MVSHLELDNESMNIAQVFPHSTCLREITALITSPVRLIVLSIIFPDRVLHLFLSRIPIPIGFLLFQCLSFYI